MHLDIKHHVMDLDGGDAMIFVIAKDRDSSAHMTVRFDRSTGREVVSVMAANCDIDAYIQMMKAIKEYKYEA